MADWDGPDLLARVQRYSLEPATSQLTTEDDWYAILTEAESYVKPVLAVHIPHRMLSENGLVLLTAAADNKTFSFPGLAAGEMPLAVELYPSLSADRMLAASYDDPAGDFVWEGDQIRIPLNRSRAFTNGAPYARYIAPPGTIDASHESTILPKHLRLLDVFWALYLWASRTPGQDPAVYESMFQKGMFGNPLIAGDAGLVGALKLKEPAGRGGAPRVYRYYRPADQ